MLKCRPIGHGIYRLSTQAERKSDISLSGITFSAGDKAWIGGGHRIVNSGDFAGK